MGGAAYSATEHAPWWCLCHEWPILNSTSHMMAATEELSADDSEMSSSRLSYRTNSVRFSSTRAMASNALAARHIMLMLGGSGGTAVCSRLCGFCWYWAMATQSSRKPMSVPTLPFCWATALAAVGSPCARLDSTATAISRHT